MQILKKKKHFQITKEITEGVNELNNFILLIKARVQMFLKNLRQILHKISEDIDDNSMVQLCSNHDWISNN